MLLVCVSEVLEFELKVFMPGHLVGSVLALSLLCFSSVLTINISTANTPSMKDTADAKMGMICLVSTTVMVHGCFICSVHHLHQVQRDPVHGPRQGDHVGRGDAW